MHKLPFLRPAALVLAVAAFGGASPALAQTEIVALPNPDANRLADEIRVLAESPRDLRALLSAAELSARLGDISAALAFFARAEAIDPEHPRLFAGRAAALVRLERPGEALQLFEAAEARGLPAREYAADRALAYDLLGAPQLAQKDYRTAMGWRPDDETARRYALSLGATGKPDEAMALLDPLLRKSDRAAWRARAFILAMNGDIPGAERIAASMMPGNMGAALTPFFRRLETLSVADRAFAVHFGELKPTQARLADARIAPALPVYVPEPRPVAVAAATPAPAPAPAVVQPAQPKGKDRRLRRERERDALAAMTAMAKPAPVPVQVAQNSAPPLPPPPVFRPVPDPVPEPVMVQPAPVRSAPARMTAAPAARSEPRPPGPARVGQEDSVLAAIVAGITVPDSERAAMETAGGPVRAAAAPSPRPAPKPAAKPPPAKPDPARAEPSRVWVQVAGGAAQKALPLTWRMLARKSPAAFKGKDAWWTPLRATNRLLAGPFRNAGEAQAFVNLVRKDGVNGFVFTSEAGQKITRLAVN